MTETMFEFFSCPVCGERVELSHRSPQWESEVWPSFYKGDGKRRGICEQLNSQGERVMIHFAVEVKYGKKIRVSHRRWARRAEQHA